MNSARDKIILICAGNEDLAANKDILEPVYEVFSASSIHQLFKILETAIPDLILLDVDTMGLDGYKALKKLKADVHFADIPIILIAAKDDNFGEDEGLNLGAADYMTKPFSAQLLLKRVENHLIIAGKNKATAEKGDAKPCILAVDDAPDILKSIFFELRGNYTVFTLPKPEMMESLLQKITPDLFLLDYNMPVLNGFDLIPIIRSFQKHKHTPVIFLTSEGTVDNVSVAIALGACDFIVKPFNPDILREKIAKHIAAG